MMTIFILLLLLLLLLPDIVVATLSTSSQFSASSFFICSIIVGMISVAAVTTNAALFVVQQRPNSTRSSSSSSKDDEHTMEGEGIGKDSQKKKENDPSTSTKNHSINNSHRGSPKNTVCHGSSSNKCTSNQKAYEQLIGNTPLVLLPQISKLIQREIYVKMECNNPSGTGKDRAVYSMIQTAERNMELPTNTPPIKTKTNATTTSTSSTSLTTTTPTLVEHIQNHSLQDNTDKNKNLSSSIDKSLSEQVHDNEINVTRNPLERDDPEQQQTITHPNNNNNKNKNNSNNNNVRDPLLLRTIIERAIQLSRTGGIVVEGSSGSTGIAAAYQCNVKGHACIVVMPDDQATEKRTIIQSLNGIVHVVPTASISNPNHYVNIARQLVSIINTEYCTDNNNNNNNNNNRTNNRAIYATFLNQFENIANYQIHYSDTGPELWYQCRKRLSAFVMSAGTGGTISGVATYLKEQDPKIQIVLVDPYGSCLYNKIQYGIAYTIQQKERTIQRHRYDTIVEGIGLDRITSNIQIGLHCIDCAIQVTDQDAVDMAHYILQTEGIWIGSSSAMNIVGAIVTAQTLPIHSTILTIVCDTGQRHITRFWNQQFIEEQNLIWPGSSSSINDNTNTTNNNNNTNTELPNTRRIPTCLKQYYL